MNVVVLLQCSRPPELDADCHLCSVVAGVQLTAVFVVGVDMPCGVPHNSGEEYGAQGNHSG